jgi:hypothetical protein
MMMLYKTTATIWTDYDPVDLELSDLARQSETGDAYCSWSETVKVADPAADEHAPDLEFFGVMDNDNTGESDSTYAAPDKWKQRHGYQ